MSDGRKSEFITEFIYPLPNVTAKLAKKQGYSGCVSDEVLLVTPERSRDCARCRGILCATSFWISGSHLSSRHTRCNSAEHRSRNLPIVVRIDGRRPPLINCVDDIAVGFQGKLK